MEVSGCVALRLSMMRVKVELMKSAGAVIAELAQREPVEQLALRAAASASTSATAAAATAGVFIIELQLEQFEFVFKQF